MHENEVVNPARAGMIRFAVSKRRKKFSKPRASGDDPQVTVNTNMPCQVNPARAGMIPPTLVSQIMTVSKPRASGDDPRVGVLTEVDRP